MPILIIPAAIRKEWSERSISAVIPALGTTSWESSRDIEIDHATLKLIKADCELHSNPNMVNGKVGEMSTYRALLHQIDAILACSSRRSVKSIFP